MKRCLTTFNTFLLLALIGIATSCETTKDGKSTKEVGFIRLHLEVPPGTNSRAQLITVPRVSPMQVTVDTAPILDERTVLSAEVVEAAGGFAIRVTYDQKGRWLIENYTSTNRGKRLAIHAVFTESRWLSAPVITQTIRDGVIVFTPDASREEAERIVRGVNNVVRKLKK